MKRIGVAGIIRSGGFHSNHLLLGRRGKEPNRGLYVLPGGGVEEDETMEQAFRREVMEETGLKVIEDPSRWQYCPDIIELSDRIIFVVHASIDIGPEGDERNDLPRDGSDLYNVGWYPIDSLPWDISPILIPVLEKWQYFPRKKPE